jgi:hypothetical protein
MTTGNQNFIKLPVKDLAKKIICDGNVYLSIGQRRFFLMKPGVLVDPGFIKKHAATSPTFDFDCVIDQDVKENFKSLFKELRYLQFEKDLRTKCLEIVGYFHEVFSKETHLLTFAMACHEEFCSLTLDEQRKMHETDMHLFRKALYSSAFSIIIAITNDYYHYPMLKDFFNLTFSLDIGLCEENYSYFVAEACNHENRLPGSGREYLLREGASIFEIEVFFRHPEKSYDFLKTYTFLSFPELQEVTLYQHELADGGGFPRGVKKGQISSWEAVVIFADSMVEILSEYAFETNVIEYMLSFKNEKLKDLPVNKVFKKMSGTLNHFKNVEETGS